MSTNNDAGRFARRLGPQGVAWLLALAVFSAWFGYVVGTDDSARAAAQAGGR